MRRPARREAPHEPIRLTDVYGEYPRHVAEATARLRRAGVEGPYAIALGDRCYTGVIETTEHGGYPVLEHVRLILGTTCPSRNPSRSSSTSPRRR